MTARAPTNQKLRRTWSSVFETGAGARIYPYLMVLPAVVIVVGCAIMLLDDRQFSRAEPMSVRLKPLPLSALLLFLVLAVANVFSTIALCGAGFCPDTPTDYILFGSSPT